MLWLKLSPAMKGARLRRQRQPSQTKTATLTFVSQNAGATVSLPLSFCKNQRGIIQHVKQLHLHTSFKCSLPVYRTLWKVQFISLHLNWTLCKVLISATLLSRVGWMTSRYLTVKIHEWKNGIHGGTVSLHWKDAYEFTIGVCSSIIQLPFLCTPKLLQGEVKHLSHNPLLRPWDPITVILWKHPEKENGSIQVIVYFRNQTFLNDHVRFWTIKAGRKPNNRLK